MVPYVPWKVSVAIFYVLNLALLALSLNHLARALEDAGGTRFGWRQGWGNRRWFMLRILPLSVCLVPIAHTLMRSQANLFLLALFCGMMAALVRGRRFQAGLCVAGAICLKIFPAYLLIVPLLRRDLRCLTGCAVGLFLGLVAIPVAALGPRQAVASYADLAEVLVGPALGLGNDQSRALELIDVPASDSQSFQALIHNTMFLDPYKRPRKVIPLARELHWLIGGAITLLTLLAGWKHRHSRGPVQPIFVGALVLIMLLLSPVCHTHYFALAVAAADGLAGPVLGPPGSAGIGHGPHARQRRPAGLDSRAQYRFYPAAAARDAAAARRLLDDLRHPGPLGNRVPDPLASACHGSGSWPRPHRPGRRGMKINRLANPGRCFCR